MIQPATAQPVTVQELFLFAKKYMLAGVFQLAILFLLVTSNVVANDTSRDPRGFFFSQSFGDLPEELEMAKKEGKQGLLLFFEAEGCPYCKAMLKNVLSNKEVQDWYQNQFISIAIDIHGDVEIKDFDGITLPSKIFSEQRKIFITPVISFIGLDGTETYRHFGMVKTPEEFLVMGEYIVDQHYFDTEYQVYASSRGIHVDGQNESSRSGETQ